MKKKLSIAIIGLGVVGRRRLNLLKENSDYEISAVCDPHALSGFEGSHLFVCKDYKELLSRSLDAVVVATPNNISTEIVVAALDRGFHVFCEKPPGRTVKEIKSVIESEKKSPQLKLKYGFNHRYHEVIKEAKAIIESKRLGEVLSLKGTYGKSGGKNFDNIWRTKREIAGGGILLDQGIHMLDLFRYFCGDFNEFYSFVQNNFWGHDVEDNAYAIMKNKNDQVAMIHSSATLWKHTFSIDITLSEGYLKLNGILSGTMSYGRESLTIGYRQFEDESKAVGNPREEIIYFDRDNSWKEELDDFSTSILEDKPVTIGSSLDAVKAMEMVYNIYCSDKEWKKLWNI